MSAKRRKKSLLRVRKWLRSLFKLLPKEKRFSIFRNSLKLIYSLPDNLELKLAQSKEELEAALTILHDAYVGAGYMAPDPSGMRVTIYHSLPSTSTAIALWDGEVIGTVSLIRDNMFGLPLDKIFGISSLRQEGSRVAEVSALAIHKDFRGRRGEILFSLIKFLINYGRNYFGTDYVVIAVHPTTVEFYEALLGFEQLTEQNVASYSFVNDAPAAGRFLNLKDVYKDLAMLYGKKKQQQNLFTYIFETEFTNINYPDRKYFNVSDPIMTPELLTYFFHEKTSVFAKLPAKELAVIKGLYDSQLYQQVFSESKIAEKDARKTKRFDVSCKGILIRGKNKPEKIGLAVKNLSAEGFYAIVEKPIQLNEEYNMKVAIGEFEIVSFKAHAIWKNAQRGYGFKLLTSKERWERLVDHLENQLLKGITGDGKTWIITDYG